MFRKRIRRMYSLLLALVLILSASSVHSISGNKDNHFPDTITQDDISIAYQTMIPEMLEIIEEFPEYLDIPEKSGREYRTGLPINIPTFEGESI